VRERTWLTTNDPEPMLRFMKERTTDRKARLLTCAVARLTWDELNDERSRRAVEVGELFADGDADENALRSAAVAAHEVIVDMARADDPGPAYCIEAFRCTCETAGRMWGPLDRRRSLTERVVGAAMRAVMPALGVGQEQLTWPTPAEWCHLTRDIFGNPFRPAVFDPKWRTTDVLCIAQGVYEDRAFDRLPLLADALMDARCADEQVLGHCRGDGHVRGCWVVDLVLGKN
jgi:hypothetical protein